MQNQDVAHNLWIMGHKFLFILQMVSHTVLHQIAPSVFSGPQLIKLVTGAAPYRAFISAMYQDAIVLAGALTAGAALAMYMI